MPVVEYRCDACGAAFDARVDDSNLDQPVECPLCHSLETQQDLSLYSVYGYGSPQDSGCSGDSAGFR